MPSMTPTHPVELHVDHPDRPLDRVSTLLLLTDELPSTDEERSVHLDSGVRADLVVACAFALATDSCSPFRLSA